MALGSSTARKNVSLKLAVDACKQTTTMQNWSLMQSASFNQWLRKNFKAEQIENEIGNTTKIENAIQDLDAFVDRIQRAHQQFLM